MKTFSTTSARITTVRKEGYYPSVSTARRLVSCIRVVLQWDPAQCGLATRLLSQGIPSYDDGLSEPACRFYARGVYGFDPYHTFSGSDLQAIDKLIAWWSMETEDLRNQRAFVVVDLNSGVSLCVVSKAERCVEVGGGGGQGL